MAMNRRYSSVRICPDCGGILQPTDPETLTTAEVAASDAFEPESERQCLLCGYTEARRDTAPEPLTR
jgi:hypothetical protein